MISPSAGAEKDNHLAGVHSHAYGRARGHRFLHDRSVDVVRPGDMLYERSHQGQGNVLLFHLPSTTGWSTGPIQCRTRLGGLLKYYTHMAACEVVCRDLWESDHGDTTLAYNGWSRENTHVEKET